MKIINTVLLLISFLTFISCAKKEYITVNTTIEIHSTATKSDILSVRSDLLTRFFDNGFRKVELEGSGNPNKYVLTSQIEKNDLEYYKSMFVSSRFDMWNTFRITDPQISSIDPNKLKGINNFKSYLELSPNSLQVEVIGMSKDETKLDEILLGLKASLHDVKNLKLVWSKDRSKYMENNYVLYMINTKGKSKAPLTEAAVQNAAAAPDPSTSSNVVNFSFNEISTKVWGEMTKKAAYDNNRSIAMLINDRVLTCPRVNQPITGGQCSMSGDFSKEEAMAMAKALEQKRFAKDIKIIKQEVVDVVEN